VRNTSAKKAQHWLANGDKAMTRQSEKLARNWRELAGRKLAKLAGHGNDEMLAN